MTERNQTIVLEQLLREGQSLRFPVYGRSMLPVLKNGDEVEVQPLAGRELRAGDIVFYRSADGGARVHRVVSEYTDSYKLAGDGHCCGVESIRGEDVFGWVAARYRDNLRTSFDIPQDRVVGLLRFRFRSVRLVARRLRARLPGRAGEPCAA